MDEKIVVALHELKDAVARQSGTWHQHATSLAIMLVVTATSAYMGSYLQARGENAAISDDLQAIKHQLSETTRTTELIKSEISQRSEVNRLRIKKLEELMEAFFALERQVLDISRRMGKSPAPVSIFQPSPVQINTALPVEKAQMLAKLYFPDVVDPLNEWIRAAAIQMEELAVYFSLTGLDPMEREYINAMVLDGGGYAIKRWGKFKAEDPSKPTKEVDDFIRSNEVKAAELKENLAAKMRDLLAGKE